MKKKCQRSFWNDAWDPAGIQEFSVHTRHIERQKWRHLCRDLAGRDGLSLEVGCGSGHLSAMLAGIGYDTILIDYAPNALASARRSFRRYERRGNRYFVQADAFALPIADACIDLVVSGGVLEHFRNPGPAVGEMARVLKPGGLFYADICPRKFSLIGLFDPLHPDPEGWYEAPMRKKQIAELIEGANLRPKRIFAAGVLPPRLVPGRGRFRLVDAAVRWSVERWQHLWSGLDGTKLAELLGLYYYVTAIKP